MERQLTELAGFDELLSKSHTKTDGHDTRADDLTRRRSNKRPKTKSIQKAAERDRGRTPKRLSGRLRDRSALDFSFRLFAMRACACLGERSEPTCIRQAHVTVPKDNITTENRRIYTEFCTKSKESLDLKQRIDNCFLQNNML